MKSTVIAILAMAANALAYNSNTTPIQVGRPNLVNVARFESSLTPGLVSVSMNVKTKSTQRPTVESMNDTKKCEFKQTLISYAGFDRATALHIRVYEFQFVSKLNSTRDSCEFVITTDKGMSSEKTTRVILHL